MRKCIGMTSKVPIYGPVYGPVSDALPWDDLVERAPGTQAKERTQSYEEQGYLKLKGLISKGGIETMRDATARY